MAMVEGTRAPRFSGSFTPMLVTILRERYGLADLKADLKADLVAGLTTGMAAVFITGARPMVRRVLLTHGVRPPQVRFRSRIEDAVAAARRREQEPA